MQLLLLCIVQLAAEEALVSCHSVMQEASSRGDTVVSMPSLQQPLSGGGSGHCSDQDSVPSRESSPAPAAPTSPSPSPLTPTDTQTQAQLEADKRAVYK